MSFTPSCLVPVSFFSGFGNDFCAPLPNPLPIPLPNPLPNPAANDLAIPPNIPGPLLDFFCVDGVRGCSGLDEGLGSCLEFGLGACGCNLVCCCN